MHPTRAVNRPGRGGAGRRQRWLALGVRGLDELHVNLVSSCGHVCFSFLAVNGFASALSINSVFSIASINSQFAFIRSTRRSRLYGVLAAACGPWQAEYHQWFSTSRVRL